MYKIDLSNAYWTIPIHESDRKWLKFRWNNRLYQFLVWPFGLGPVPRWFTKLLKPIISLLRRLGARNIIYMDDLWGGEQNLEVSALYAWLTVKLLQALGFVVNLPKSVLDPTQILDDYLGFIVNSIELRLYLPRQKIIKIQKACKDLLKQEIVTVRMMAQVIGQLVAASRAVFPAPLHYRQMQMTQISALLKNQKQYGTEMTLTSGCKQELRWWIENLDDWNGKSFALNIPSNALVIESDASNKGWGAVCEGVTTQGMWTEEEKRMHINEKELLAASLATQAFTRNRKVSHVHIKTDNMTTMSQINKMGSTTSQDLVAQTKVLWDYCLQRNIMLTAEHLQGSLNIIADRESRQFNDSSNWKLARDVFRIVNQKLGPATIDLFADRTNFQLPKYVSWKLDPAAVTTDAFSISWKGEMTYAFPPFCLIGRCLNKVRVDKAQMIIITPVWQGQPWYSTLLQMTTADPVLLPELETLLTDPNGEIHPLLRSRALKLAAWRISGVTQETLRYQQQLRNYYRTNCQGGRKRLMTAPGRGGAAGVVNGDWIQFQPLWNM